MPLAADVARCNGQTDARDRTCHVCVACERRTAPRFQYQPFMNGRMYPGGRHCEDRIPSMTFVPWQARGPLMPLVSAVPPHGFARPVEGLAGSFLITQAVEGAAPRAPV